MPTAHRCIHVYTFLVFTVCVCVCVFTDYTQLRSLAVAPNTQLVPLHNIKLEWYYSLSLSLSLATAAAAHARACTPTHTHTHTHTPHRKHNLNEKYMYIVHTLHTCTCTVKARVVAKVKGVTWRRPGKGNRVKKYNYMYVTRKQWLQQSAFSTTN